MHFLDVRLSNVGGGVREEVAVFDGDSLQNYNGLSLELLKRDIAGRHVLVATHGFHVDRAAGIACLANWEELLGLAQSSVVLGLLWPGDSICPFGLDYPEEPRVATDAAAVVAPFMDTTFGDAASLSFVSHSLGARLVLQTVSLMRLPARRLILMAGAIDDDCLSAEFADVPGRVEEVSVLASHRDEVLSALFPIGNLAAGIVAIGHPWWNAALGRGGPAASSAAKVRRPYMIPDDWNYGHSDYLRISPPPVPQVSSTADILPADPNAPCPADAAAGWQSAWSAAFVSARL